MRTDLYFFDFGFQNVLKQLENKKDKYNLILSSKVWYNKGNYPFSILFNDYMWFADFETSKYISSLYDCITKYSPCCLEELIAIHISSKDLSICHFDCCFNLDRRTRGHEQHLIESQELTQKRRLEGDYY
jgi:hypothetical protein